MRYFFFIITIIIVFACKRLEDPKPNPERGNSFLKFINAHATAPDLNLYSVYYNQTSLIASGTTYARALPQIGYISLQSSDEPTASGVGTYYFFTKPTHDTATFHPYFPVHLKKDLKQTLFAIDSVGKPKFLLFQDTYSPPDSGFALVRFLNLKPDLDLFLTNNSTQTASIPFQQISSFITLPSGTQSLVAKDNNGNEIAKLENITLKSRAVYTCYLSYDLQITQHE